MTMFVICYLVSIVLVALAALYRCNSVKWLLIEGVIVFFVILICFCSPSKCDAVKTGDGRPAIRAFGDGKIQIRGGNSEEELRKGLRESWHPKGSMWRESEISRDYTYVNHRQTMFGPLGFVWNVLKWAKRGDNIYLVTSNSYFVINSTTGEGDKYSRLDEIPYPHQDVFFKMLCWGPYGQFWEDLLPSKWNWIVSFFCTFVFLVHVCVFLFGRNYNSISVADETED